MSHFVAVVGEVLRNASFAFVCFSTDELQQWTQLIAA
jgi:hypothetical protein